MKIHTGSGDRMEITMNRFASAVGISLIALSSLAGVARAEMWPGADIQQSHLDSPGKELKGKNFTIVEISTLDNGDSMVNPYSYSTNTQSMQYAIHRNQA